MTPDQLVSKLDNILLTPQDLAIIIEKQIKTRLQTSTTPDGTPMKPLKQSTIEAKVKKGQPAKPWYGTGKLVDSFRITPTSDGVTISNSQDYFKYVNEERPVVGVFEETIDDANKIIQEKIRQLI